MKHAFEIPFGAWDLLPLLPEVCWRHTLYEMVNRTACDI